MLVSAVIWVSAPAATNDSSGSCYGPVPERPEAIGGEPLACLEILGSPILHRTVARLRADGVQDISLVATDRVLSRVPVLTLRPVEVLRVQRPPDLWGGVENRLGNCIENGAETILVIRLGAYAEIDFHSLLQFHRAKQSSVTRLHDGLGPLDMWFIDCAQARKTGLGLRALLGGEHPHAAVPFYLNSYVNRLAAARDLRQLVVDAFLSRCAITPQGRQAKPGVWLDEGARVHRRARVVAPAYIGRGARVHASALITRFSNVECGCDVDSGTVVEDASILAHTYLGAWLDVSHAVVHNSTLVHLRHNVTVEIRDERLVGRMSGIGRRRSPQSDAEYRQIQGQTPGSIPASKWNGQPDATI